MSATGRQLSNKEAADKILSARLKLTKLEEELKSSFEGFKVVDMNLVEKLKGNLLSAALELLKQ